MTVGHVSGHLWEDCVMWVVLSAFLYLGFKWRKGFLLLLARSVVTDGSYFPPASVPGGIKLELAFRIRPMQRCLHWDGQFRDKRTLAVIIKRRQRRVVESHRGEG